MGTATVNGDLNFHMDRRHDVSFVGYLTTICRPTCLDHFEQTVA